MALYVNNFYSIYFKITNVICNSHKAMYKYQTNVKKYSFSGYRLKTIYVIKLKINPMWKAYFNNLNDRCNWITEYTYIKTSHPNIYVFIKVIQYRIWYVCKQLHVFEIYRWLSCSNWFKTCMGKLGLFDLKVFV